MNRIQHIRRLAGALAGLACALVACAAAAPAALASVLPPPVPPGWNKHPTLPLGHVVGPAYKIPVHAVVIGGMPGWQITLIAAGAALLAATVAVLVGRARAAHRKAITTATRTTPADGPVPPPRETPDRATSLPVGRRG